MSAGVGVAWRWRRVEETLSAPIDVAPAWLPLAEDYARHRLLAARACSAGLVHPIGVEVTSGRLTLSFVLGALDASARRPSCFTEWRDHRLLPLLAVLLRCHDEGISGLAAHPLVDARWVPPVDWFLPTPSTGSCERDRGAWAMAARWIEAEERAGRGGQDTRSLTDALHAGDLLRLRRLVAEARARDQAAGEVAPPSFLTLLTAAELFERVRTVYRYRLVAAADAAGRPATHPGQLVLELDRGWRDPHFPSIVRPSPREVWDELVDESKVTPVLAISEEPPNPLVARLGTDRCVRWLDTHLDQPLVHVEPDGRPLPPHGFVRLHLTGDNALMERKRAFTRFTGDHPALSGWLRSSRPSVPFRHNPQPREHLEDAILATRGIFAVQGPPGTGKTHLATEVVRRFLARAPGGRVLVCAKEHFALDHILRKIDTALRRDQVPFRAWRSVSLARRRRSRGEVDETWQSPAVTRDLGGRRWTPQAAVWATWQATTSALHDQRLARLGQEAANLFFATTMDASIVELLGQRSFDLVIVEEAGKCYPSELLHALCLGNTCLMIGDQRQLPPYQEGRTREAVESWQAALDRAARDPRVRTSMRARFGAVFDELDALMKFDGAVGAEEQAWLRPFELLFDRLTTRHRLEEQFRLEAPLSRVVGTVFYDRPFVHRKHELVECGVLDGRPLGDVIPSELDVPMLWIDIPHMIDQPDATEDAAKRGVRDNAFEVQVVADYLARLEPGAPIDLVILTPYNDQKRLLLDDRDLRVLCDRLARAPFEQVVRTTDEYQGREAELTVISLVRNNSLGARAWGFMAEPERLNVMFSRSRFRQVIVGCSAHIRRHADEYDWLARFWKAYVAEARDPSCARIVAAREVRRG